MRSEKRTRSIYKKVGVIFDVDFFSQNMYFYEGFFTCSLLYSAIKSFAIHKNSEFSKFSHHLFLFRSYKHFIFIGKMNPQKNPPSEFWYGYASKIPVFNSEFGAQPRFFIQK